MSDIEIGSVWKNKCDGVEAIVESVGSDCVGFTQAINGKKYFYNHAVEEFKEYYEPKEQGRKDDSSKRRYSLLPKGAVNSVVDVLEFGSKKYADNNWQKVPDAKTRYYDAAMRHLDAWLNGDLKDAETGLPHLAHAICCLMFLMWFDSEAADD